VLHVVLVEPEIPPNTGNIGRLCLATDSRLHLVGPLGFSLEERDLKRAGLDYWPLVDLCCWESFEALRAAADSQARFFFLTTKSDSPHWSAQFRDGDYLVFGSESRGLPESLLEENRERTLTIPQSEKVRSLNLATAVGIVLYEARRQLSR
jgi:tRNA (cytidine/uridine-2'-O-)-methyltransferase